LYALLAQAARSSGGGGGIMCVEHLYPTIADSTLLQTGMHVNLLSLAGQTRAHNLLKFF
jgi:hypothetical protein